MLIAALALLVATQQVADVPGHGRVPEGIQNGLHGPWFAIVTLVLLRLMTRFVAGARALAATAAAAIVLSVGTEALQTFTGGDPETLDVASDLVGGSAALAFMHWRQSRPALAIVVALALLTLSFGRAWLAFAVQLHRNAIFPSLVSYAAPWVGGVLESDSAVAVVQAPHDFMGESGLVLQVDLRDATWPGVGIVEPVPDWSRFDVLAVDVFVPAASASLDVTVSIRLRYADVDHVYQTWKLSPGPHRLVFHYRDRFDPERVEVTRVVVYSSRPYANRRLYIGRIALEATAH